jgi:hypothetical protein
MATTTFGHIEKKHISYEINTKFRMHFESINPLIAHMYVMNSDGNYVDVPQTLITVYTCEPDGVTQNVHKITDPVIEQLRNKSRMGYLHSYYVLDKNIKYDIHVLGTIALRLEPQFEWKLINYQLTDYYKY